MLRFEVRISDFIYSLDAVELVTMLIVDRSHGRRLLKPIKPPAKTQATLGHELAGTILPAQDLN